MSRFGLSERTAIEAGIYRRASFSQIAKEIGSTARSVSAEIRRNRTLSIAPKFNGKDCRCSAPILCSKQYYTSYFTKVHGHFVFFAGKMCILQKNRLQNALPCLFPTLLYAYPISSICLQCLPVAERLCL